MKEKPLLLICITAVTASNGNLKLHDLTYFSIV